jgi:Tfp pilus assembly protein PilE
MFLTLFALAVAAVVSLVALASWQNSVADSKRDDAKAYTARATLLQEGAAEGQQTADLLTAYVTEGDESLLPQIQAHTAAGVDKLTTALSQDGASDISQLSVDAAGLIDGAAGIIALRQGGDVVGAAAALQQMSGQFEQLIETQNTAIETEQAAAASALSDADSAESLAAWLVVGSLTTSIVATLGLLVTLRRTVLRRRLPGTASPM